MVWFFVLHFCRVIFTKNLLIGFLVDNLIVAAFAYIFRGSLHNSCIFITKV